jgi:CMP-N-acetylneuraminic acid synthetase
MNFMSNLAIVPARGGSKRIPRKNINPFLGKPIIAYSIEAAIQSNLFDEIMVSTDDEEIAEIASNVMGQKSLFCVLLKMQTILLRLPMF